MYVQISQVVINPTFSYSGRGFASPVIILLFIHLRGVRRKVIIEDSDKILVGSSVFYLSVATSLPVLSEGIHLLWPSFSGLHACRSLSCYSLFLLPGSVPALPQPIPQKLNFIFAAFPGLLSKLQLFLCICFFPFSLTERTLLSHAGSLAFLAQFLVHGESALGCCGRFPYRSPSTVPLPCPWGQCPRESHSLSPWRSGILLPVQGADFRPYLSHMLRIAGSSTAWSLQPSTPPILTSSIYSLISITIRPVWYICRKREETCFKNLEIMEYLFYELSFWNYLWVVKKEKKSYTGKMVLSI